MERRADGISWAILMNCTPPTPHLSNMHQLISRIKEEIDEWSVGTEL
jgi:hypothetical protein